MNFINDVESPEAQMELKYCERCGGLFLRPTATAGVHCGSCSLHLAARPHLAENLNNGPRHKARKPRMVKGPRPEIMNVRGGVEVGYLQGVAIREVHPC
jgi:hypothetical protein